MTHCYLRALGLLALSAGLALAQPAGKKDPPPKEPAKPAAGSLEDTLDKALRNSADIKVAEAKVRDAELELDRVRQQVLMKGTILHTELRAARKLLEAVEAIYTRAQEGYNKSVIPEVEVLTSRLNFEKQKAEVEKLEAALKAFRGEFAIQRGVKSVAFSPDGRFLGEVTDGGLRIWDSQTGKALTAADAVWGHLQADTKPPVQPAMTERVRKWLDEEVESKLSEEEQLRTEDAFGMLLKRSANPVPVRFMGNEARDFVYFDNIRGKNQIGALLQSFEDSAPDLAIVVRDYGLMMTTKDRVPEGAVRAVDLWKAKGERMAEPAKKDVEKK